MLLDTVVLIVAASPGHPARSAVERFLIRTDGPFYASAITRVELLGYHGASPADLALREYIYDRLGELPLVRPVLDLAADLRRQRRGIKTVDSLIAATALLNAMPLATANVRDFTWVGGLTVVDPTASEQTTEI